MDEVDGKIRLHDETDGRLKLRLLPKSKKKYQNIKEGELEKQELADKKTEQLPEASARVLVTTEYVKAEKDEISTAETEIHPAEVNDEDNVKTEVEEEIPEKNARDEERQENTETVENGNEEITPEEKEQEKDVEEDGKVTDEAVKMENNAVEGHEEYINIETAESENKEGEYEGEIEQANEVEIEQANKGEKEEEGNEREREDLEGTLEERVEVIEGGHKKVVIVESGTYTKMEYIDIHCEEECACPEEVKEGVVPNMEYKMDHSKRGIAVIFNNGTFNSTLDLKERVGYKEEGEKLKDAFKSLGFDARYYQDLTVQNIVTVLSLVIKEGHGNADCFVAVFMTRGIQQPGTTHDVIYGKDGPLWVHNIVAKFNGDGCASLRGKPKVFFFDASRGDQVDTGVRALVDTETDSSRRVKKTIPLEADILVAHSTVSGYTAHPDDPSGSTYIRSLRKTLVDHGRTKDIHWLLTRVSHLVAEEFESTSVDRALNRRRMMPTYSSTLTRILSFPEKKNKDQDFFL